MRGVREDTKENKIVVHSQYDKEAFTHDVVQEPKVAAEYVVHRLNVFDLDALKYEQQRGEEEHIDGDEDFPRGVDTSDGTLFGRW